MLGADPGHPCFASSLVLLSVVMLRIALDRAGLLLMAAYPADDEGAGNERVGALGAAATAPVLGREVLVVLDGPAHGAGFLCIGDRLVRVHGRHRPVNERAGGVAVAESGFAELSVVEDHGIRAVADRCGLSHACRFDRLGADRSRWQESPEQHPLITEFDANRLISVPWLERLAPVQRDVVREHDLTVVLTHDAFTAGQLDQHVSHD